MNRSKTVVVAGAAIAVTMIASCSNSETSQATSTQSPGAPVASSSTVSPAAHNRADMMFARQMIPHHQQAIQMSDMIADKQDIDPRVTDVAKQIKAAQGPEIETMQRWLNEWGMPGMSGMPGHNDMPGDMRPDHGGMHGPDDAHMGGMMSPADMQALQNAQGPEASRLFLSGMITHHQGAITMAQNEIKNGQFPAAVALATSIETSQRTEIDTMDRILQSL